MAVAKDAPLTHRQSFEAVLRESTDVGLTWHPAAELLWNDEATAWADRQLQAAGAVGVLLGRMSFEDQRLWLPERSSTVILDADTLTLPGSGQFHGEKLALTATCRTPDGQLGRLGISTIIGHRVRGSCFDVVPIGAAPTVVYAANAIMAAREQLEWLGANK